MKKIFDFGKIDYTGTGRKSYPVTVEMEYTEQDGKKRFSGEHFSVAKGGKWRQK